MISPRRTLFWAVILLGVLPLCAGLACAALLWWTLPYAPRAVLNAGPNHTLQGISPDSQFVVTTDVQKDPRSQDTSSVRLWDANTGRQLARFLSAAHVIESCEIDSTRKLLFIAEFSPAQVRVIDIESKAEVAALLPSPAEEMSEMQIGGLHLAPDGRTLAYTVLEGGRADLNLWDIPTRQLRATIHSEANRGLSFHPWAFSPDGALIATCESSLAPIPREVIVVRDTVSGRTVGAFKDFEGSPFFKLTFSPDSATLAMHSFADVTSPFRSGAEDVTYVWDLKTGRRLLVLDDTVSPIFTEGGAALHAIATDRTSGQRAIKRWDLATEAPPQELLSIPRVDRAEFCYLQPPAGNGIALIERGVSIKPSVLDEVLVWVGLRNNARSHTRSSVTLVDTASWTRLATLSADSTSLSPDGLTLAVSDSDHKSTRLYDVPPRRPWFRIVGWSALLAASVLVACKRLLAKWQLAERDA